jgi:hypothetical protein
MTPARFNRIVVADDGRSFVEFFPLDLGAPRYLLTHAEVVSARRCAQGAMIRELDRAIRALRLDRAGRDGQARGGTPRGSNQRAKERGLFDAER